MHIIFQKLAFVITFYTKTLLPEIRSTRQHWNQITDGLILGGLPIATQLGSIGNHAAKIIAECKSKNRPLGLVCSVVNEFEMKGEYLGLTPVSPEYWKSQGVAHEPIPMEDFGGEIEIKKVKEIVDLMAKTIQEENKSVYVHCKAGKGRSFSFVACYLLLHSEMDVTQIFAFLRKQRPQVSPSSAQFALIERFRAEYCPNKAPLNMHSKDFASYRKGLGQYKNHPFLHAGIVGFITQFITKSAFYSTAIGFTAGLLSAVTQFLFERYNQASYEKLNTQDGLSELTLQQLLAVKSGMDSAFSWKAWAQNLSYAPSTLQYSCYRGGIRLKQENAPVCEKISEIIHQKSRSAYI